jgi:hypothetical protein
MKGIEPEDMVEVLEAWESGSASFSDLASDLESVSSYIDGLYQRLK